MSSPRKLERDFVKADIAAVSELLAQLGEEDVMTRFGLEARLAELNASLAEAEEVGADQTASAAIFFGGKPVFGSRGIESQFGSSAIMKFQDLVSKVMAHEASGSLGQRGLVPQKSASTLHVTNIVRGSFGFLLEEVQPQWQLVDTPLKAAVEEATLLLDALGEPDEERFQTAIETTNDRVLATAREFFELMRQNGATLRVVVGESDKSFGPDAVVRAADRASSTAVEDVAETLFGELSGFLPDAHQFEFRLSDSRTVRGKVDRTISALTLAEYNRELVNVECVARVMVKRVRRNDVIVRENYTLTGIARTPDEPRWL